MKRARQHTNRANSIPRARATGVRSPRQSGTEKLTALAKSDMVQIYIAEVTAVYSERNTCDIISVKTNAPLRDVPILTKGGLIDDEVYGELDLPAVGDRVVVGYVDGREGMPVVLGFVIPYLFNYFAVEQTAVNSTTKTNSLTLLESGKPNLYRRIFKSGTSIEVAEDGSVFIETPDGSYLNIDATAGTFDLTDSSGNTFVSSGTTVTINGNLEVDQ